MYTLTYGTQCDLGSHQYGLQQLLWLQQLQLQKLAQQSQPLLRISTCDCLAGSTHQAPSHKSIRRDVWDCCDGLEKIFCESNWYIFFYYCSLDLIAPETDFESVLNLAQYSSTSGTYHQWYLRWCLVVCWDPQSPAT